MMKKMLGLEPVMCWMFSAKFLAPEVQRGGGGEHKKILQVHVKLYWLDRKFLYDVVYFKRFKQFIILLSLNVQ